ncbi:MAG TPA: Stk1 family PASTA domain-containing Ser/Thr kinase [Nocardioidaceae bacterium]|nr:Stk1 family PASTA domain-containing Ser/Thr kinase [Nocardioidaceae bacterium]
MDRTVADPMIGRLLDGRYRVGPRIARGGMATVYEATDMRLDRVCALKIMHSNLGDDEDFAGRFVREARSAARLSHPNVVAVFDQGDDDGTLFLAMEYIPGHTLRDLVRKEAPMAPAKALAMIDPILSALAAAHEAGMIHRDVKPENVLLADDGRVKVADFGLARAISAETQHTATGGILIGTVSYLSPELVVDGRADARSDVYAAGVLIYEMLTGRKPHEGESPIQVAYKHVHEDVPPPSDEVPGIPPYVDALVARATARDRELRPADARVLLHQVRRVRAALDHGIADDPELTADLTPTTPVLAIDSIDYVREDSPTIVDPHDAGRENTSVIGALPARRSPGTVPADRRPDRNGPGDRGNGQRPRRRSRKGPILLVLVLLLAAAAGVAGWYFGMGRYTATPGVINLSQAQAEQKVEAAGLAFEVAGSQFSETVTAGSVIRTDPAAGSKILEDGTVSAVVSKGPERYEVPALRGMSEDEAQEALDKAHLSFGDSTERFSDKVGEGVVLRSLPDPGTELKPDAAVDLVVSKGPRPIKVPDFTGKDAEKAEAALDKRGLEVQTSSQHDDEIPEGDVIAQTPSGGTLYRGDTVRLLVSEGPEMVQVPDVKGAGVDDARNRLEAAGFEVRTKHSQFYVGLEYVVASDPKQGSMARKGSTITLSLV